VASVPRKTPRAGPVSLNVKLRWVESKLVVKAAFVEWTYAGHLRHCTSLPWVMLKEAVGLQLGFPRS
jgi:hypothetical protein